MLQRSFVSESLKVCKKNQTESKGEISVTDSIHEMNLKEQLSKVSSSEKDFIRTLEPLKNLLWV